MCPWVGSLAPSFVRQLLWAPERCGVYLTTGGIAPVSLWYIRRSLAGDPALDCVTARLSPVVYMPAGDVCSGPQCSLAWLRPAALEYRSCYLPGGLARLPQCVRPLGCGLLCPVRLQP